MLAVDIWYRPYKTGENVAKPAAFRDAWFDDFRQLYAYSPGIAEREAFVPASLTEFSLHPLGRVFYEHRFAN